MSPVITAAENSIYFSHMWQRGLPQGDRFMNDTLFAPICLIDLLLDRRVKDVISAEISHDYGLSIGNF